MKAPVGLIVGMLSVAIVSATAQTSTDSPHLTPRTIPPSAVAAEATRPAPPSSTPADPAPAPAAPAAIVVPAGTKIPLTMKQGITTKNARPGDPVYAETAFPITRDDHIVIPAGTFVQGEVRRVVRPGRVKGRAELQMSFTSMIFPNGYTILLPGAVQGTPGSQDSTMKGTEGTIQGNGGKGKDAATIVNATIPGAGIGAIADGGKGAAIGGAAGGVIGLATVLLSRGPEIQLTPGSSVEMVLENNIDLDSAKLHRTGN